jgi:hypothetical protein
METVAAPATWDVVRNGKAIADGKSLHPFANRLDYPNQLVAQRDGPSKRHLAKDLTQIRPAQTTYPHLQEQLPRPNGGHRQLYEFDNPRPH